MILIKCITIAAAVMAVSAASTINIRIEPKFIKAINDVVKSSNTCIILVLNSRIQLVTPEINASNQLAAHRNALKNKNLVLIKSTFKPRSAKDIAQKLNRLGKKHTTFLAYFKAATGKPVKGSITTEITRPVGLLGNLLAGLGISEDDEGLVPAILSSLGINTNVKDINTVKFEV